MAIVSQRWRSAGGRPARHLTFRRSPGISARLCARLQKPRGGCRNPVVAAAGIMGVGLFAPEDIHALM